MTEKDTNENVTPEEKLLTILQNPEQRILSLLSTSTNPQDQQEKQETRNELIEIVKHLFREIEATANKFHVINKGKEQDEDGNNKVTVEHTPLSGLSELFLPESKKGDPLDVETIWGQVELQNNALNKLVKKSIKRLSKSPEEIVVLDMGILSSDEDDGMDNMDSEEEEQSMNDETDGSNDDEEEEEERRIRERMERAMEDAESDEDGSEDEDEKEPSMAKSKLAEKKEELYDPVAEEMKDGFFDLIDMEEYADEEEDYLPREAYGETEEEKKKNTEKTLTKKSFHQKQRDGDFLNHSDDDEGDDEDFEELYEEDASPMKRKKYREDEDIEALYSLYQSGNDEDSEAEDAANMTAAEFFGAPSKKHMERYQSKKAKAEIKGDDDSWGEYDFEQDNVDSDDDENDAEKYGKRKRNDENESPDEESDEEEVQQKSKMSQNGNDKKADNSRYAKQQEKLRQQTEQLENEMIAEKPWQMTGETKGTARPLNSLLEGTPEFEFASKQAPTITIEHTANLEDVIKKRILAEDWDDVVPRELPDVGWHKKRGELPEVSQEKSKLGLGELYEREYLKKAVGFDKDAEEKKTEEDKAKDEMKQLFANLCSKLDGLSNYHFAPRPIAEEVEVRPSSTPAIAMEEVLPLHVNDARAVAPEEVYATKRGREGVLRGESEMDQQERKRLRQSKKTARRKVRKEKLADEKLISRLEPGLGLNNPYEKRKMREELAVARSKGKVTTGEKELDGKYGSSGTFFQRLQAEAQQSIKGEASGEVDRPKKSKPKSSALKL